MIGRFLSLAGVTWAMALAVSAVTIDVASAEVVVLKSGGRIEGELVNRDRARTDPLIIVDETGVRLSLSPSQVERVVVKKDVEKQYEERLPKIPNTAAGHWEMAAWCQEAGLSTQRKTHLEEVIRLDPNHEAARAALGYSRIGEAWMKPDEWMRKQGYVYYEGRWCLPHEVEIDKREREWELATKKWRKDIKTWIGWVEDNGRKSVAGMENLRGIRDEAAAPALVEVLTSDNLPRSLRMQSLELLSRMPATYSTSTLITMAMKDRDEEMRDKSLDELRRRRSTQALHAFIKDLKSKDNTVVRQAAHCLAVLGDPEATVPLIDALVTSHKFAVTQGGSPGQLGVGFGGPTDGSGGGGGSFNFGTPKPQIVTRKIE
ncbi:MAG TPA: HEAT repeat domain-containing protein, partial [Pirellulaceae bacterium]|nr:HEAT repeat domain-containing protein [Pirellulaceae bacterium]